MALFTRISGLCLCFVFDGLIAVAFIVCTNWQHSPMPRYLSKVLSRVTVIDSKKNVCLHFTVGLANVSIPNLPYPPRKQELGLRGSAAVWHIIF